LVQLEEEWLNSSSVAFFLPFFVSKVCSKNGHFHYEELGIFMALGANSRRQKLGLKAVKN
jgi:hypothetical protein